MKDENTSLEKRVYSSRRRLVVRREGQGGGAIERIDF